MAISSHLRKPKAYTRATKPIEIVPSGKAQEIKKCILHQTNPFMMMDVLVFKKFFEALPDIGDQVRGQMRTKSAFSLACGIPLGYLRGIAKGKNDFSNVHKEKVLPVMLNYGFKVS